MSFLVQKRRISVQICSKNVKIRHILHRGKKEEIRRRKIFIQLLCRMKGTITEAIPAAVAA